MIKYDSPRINQINDFLQKMNKLSLQNDEDFLDNNIIYSELCKTGLKKTDLQINRDYKYIKPLFEEWKKRYKKSKKLRVYEAGRPFLEFITREYIPNNDYIKLYVPLDYEHVYKASNLIFDYIEKLNPIHQSKIANKIRSDNVVIRIHKSSIECVPKIIDFINNNKYIQEGLNQTNPFIPTVNNIGYMEDNGKSYNGEMACIIRDYLYYNKQNNITEVSVEKFAKFYKMYCKYPEYQEAFNIATGDILNKKTNIIQTTEINNYTKDKMILEAIRTTYEKYGISHIIAAIECILDEKDFKYITNEGNNYRNFLIQNVGAEYFKKYISNTIIISGYPYFDNPRTNANIICKMLFSNSLTIDIDKICLATLQKYNENQLINALINYTESGKSSGFTKYAQEDYEQKENLRAILMEYDKEHLLDALNTSLRFKGIEINSNNPREIINQYVNALAEELRQTKN